MKIICLDKTTSSDVLNLIFVRLRNILADLEYCYPFFSIWLGKVFKELTNSDRRKILLCVEGHYFNILGLAIIKNDLSEKKICTLRVLSGYQRRGIGTALLKRCLVELNDPLPLITVSGIQMDSFGPFLKRNGFKIKGKVKSLYKKGLYEYFFNKEYEHSVVLMSIQPIYAKAIAEKTKTVEFRKKTFSKSVRRVFVYESYPTKKIIGFFEVTEVDEDVPEKLWEKYHKVGGITKENFDAYYSKHFIGFAIRIKEFYSFEEPLDPRNFDPDFRAPQSYCYIDNVEFLNWLGQFVSLEV